MMLDGQHSLFAALLDCDMPVIAAVNGTAAGMGAHLALACDLVIAGDQAKFVEVFARRGLVPDALGPWLLPRIIGVRRTMELFLLAEDLPAQQAHEFGLVNRVVPHDEVQTAAAEWAERLADGPTRSFALTKWLVNRSLDTDRATMSHEEAMAVELNSGTEDAAEGVAAFQQAPTPRMEGLLTYRFGTSHLAARIYSRVTPSEWERRVRMGQTTPRLSVDRVLSRPCAGRRGSLPRLRPPSGPARTG